jgi:magnesium chelatase family protein
MIKYFTLNQLNTLAIIGVEAIEVFVQIEIVKTIPSFVIVGMANRAISESKERIRAVFNSCGINFPNGKIIVNLCPADVLKEGSHYDLPIIIGLLQAMKIIKNSYENTIFFGELSLNGDFLKTKGLLATALYCYKNNKYLIIHEDYYPEMIKVFQEKSYLIKVCNNLNNLINNQFQTPVYQLDTTIDNINKEIFQDIIGQSIGKRGAALSLIGRHNILFFGPPGSGKSLISKSLQQFQLPLNQEDKLMVSNIYSTGGLLQDNQLITKEPFRCPHNSISYVGLMGGGNVFKPGEISLAHKGLLFLDEMAEFNSQSLDMLRQVMEDKYVIIGRSQYNIKIPSDFQLVATMNPCKCGYYGDLNKRCICSPTSIANYQKKISGPLMDRIDIRIFMGNNYQENNIDNVNYYKWVLESRQFINERNIYNINNNNLKNQDISLLNFSIETINIINEFCEKNLLSLRRKLKILGLARTIADSEKSLNVQLNHGLEAIFYTSKMLFN